MSEEKYIIRLNEKRYARYSPRQEAWVGGSREQAWVFPSCDAAMKILRFLEGECLEMPCLEVLE